MRDAMRSRAAWIMSMLSIDRFGIKTHFKHVGEVGDDAILDGAQRRFVAEQLFHRSYGLTFAGDNQVEVTKIGIDVERKAVRGDPAGDVNADRGNFSTPSMYASQTLDAKGFDAEV